MANNNYGPAAIDGLRFPRLSIELTQQALTLADVRSVVVTEVAQDGESGEFVRELRVFGGDPTPIPPITDMDAVVPGQGHLLITLRLRSADRRRIRISVPPLEF